MIVGLLSIELFIAGAHSLKEKRMVLRAVKDRLRRLNVAVSEVDHQDVWQRAGFGIVTIARSEVLASRELQAVVEEIERIEPGLVSRSEVEFLT